MRALLALPIAALLAIPTAAQDRDPDNAVAGATLPAGWSARADRGSMENVKFRGMGPGWHVTLGPALILWRDADRAEGAYTVTASMAQTVAPRHAEGYGIFIGGNDLNGAGQAYLYFLVRGDGTFLVKSRTGAETANLSEAGWTTNSAVHAADTSGRASNQLEVRVTAENVQFRVNGELVWSGTQPAARTNGHFGLRVNHNLDVHVGALAKS